jgi:hypothetical protein
MALAGILLAAIATHLIMSFAQMVMHYQLGHEGRCRFQLRGFPWHRAYRRRKALTQLLPPSLMRKSVTLRSGIA